MMVTSRHPDGQTTYKCPACGKHETVFSESALTHESGGSRCLQNQINDLRFSLHSLENTVSAIVDRLGGDV